MRMGVLVLVAGAAMAADALPRLMVDGTIRDLGRVKPRAKATATFTLLNLGKAPLAIRKVMAAEGVETKLSAATVKPGCKSVLKASFTAGVANEPREEKVVVISNDPDKPFLELTLRAVISPVVPGETIIAPAGASATQH
jgi:hypothetical protein